MQRIIGKVALFAASGLTAVWLLGAGAGDADARVHLEPLVLPEVSGEPAGTLRFAQYKPPPKRVTPVFNKAAKRSIKKQFNKAAKRKDDDDDGGDSPPTQKLEPKLPRWTNPGF